MCGIFGTIPYTNRRFFKRALNLLTHRGPDGYVIWHGQEISKKIFI